MKRKKEEHIENEVESTSYPVHDTSGDWGDMLFSYYYRGKVLLKRYFWILLISIAVCMAYKAYQQMKAPIVYSSSAQMIVSGSFNTGASEGSYLSDLSNFFGTEIRLMESHRVRKAAQDRISALKPDIHPVPVTLYVRQSPRASIFLLEARGAEPEYTQAFLDSVMHEYLNFKDDMRSQSAEDTFVSITDKILDLQEEIEDVENKKVAFQKENNIVFIQEQGSSTGEYLAKLNDQLAEMKILYQRLSAFNFEDYLEKPFTPEIQQILKDPGYNLPVEEYLNTQKNLKTMLAELDEFSENMRPNHPRIVGLKQAIEKQEYLLKVFRRQSIRQLVEKRNSLEAELLNLENIVKEWEIKALDYSQRLAEFERIDSQLSRLKSSYDKLLSLTQSIDVNTNIAQHPISILEPASPAYQVPIPFFKEVMMGALMGLALGGGLIYLIGIIDNRIFSPDDISSRYSEPVLGLIPIVRPSKKSTHENETVPIVTQKDDRTVLAEAFRTIRSSLLYLYNDEFQPHIFIVTSSIPNEGKSTITSNLAAAFSFTASKVLLIDADLRIGHLHEAFNVSNPIGLTDFVADKLKLNQVIQQTPYKNLDFVSRGQHIAGTGELLMSSEMDRFIEEARKKYDFIFFDSPPVLAADDTPGFAIKSDAVLFVMRSTFTRIRQTKQAIQLLNIRNAPLIGYILNHIDSHAPGYSYGYYNHYYAQPESENENTETKNT